jgi:hypothetical protein
MLTSAEVHGLRFTSESNYRPCNKMQDALRLESTPDYFHSFGSPQSPNLYTSWENASTERRLTDFAVKSIQQCWEEYKTGVEYYTRPEFEAEEKVWTCRRICSLFVSGIHPGRGCQPIDLGTTAANCFSTH